MAYLYVNAQGREVRSHSYSAGSLFHECAQKYKLARLDGWKEREQRASMQFGIALEAAIKTYHELDLAEALITFRSIWGPLQNAALTYTHTEQNWEALGKSGEEMIRLYDLRLPLFPISPSYVKFQIKYYKELFPGTEMAGIEFVAYVDMLTKSRANLGDPMIVDIKTSGVALDSTPGILALDQQLRTYAWVTGISEVGFLWFQKCGRSLERGDFVALLENAGAQSEPKLYAGESAVVIKYQEAEPARPADPEKPRSKSKEAVPEETWIVENESVIEQMFEKCGRGQTKEEKDARTAFIQTNAVKVDKNTLTRQRVSFVSAHIGAAEQLEAARQIGQDVAQIVYSNQENFWPLQGGIRYPNNKCCSCAMRGNCLTNAELRDKLVFRSDEDWDVRQEIEET
jgi:hypothetical protein